MNIVQILMALVAYYQQGKSVVPLLASDVLTPKNLKDFYTNFPNSQVAIDQALKGKEVDWTVLASDLDDFLINYSARPDARESFIKVMKTFKAWLRTGSASSEAAIRKYSAHVDSSTLRSLFTTDAVDQKSAIKKLLPLVKKLGGQPGADVLTQDESKAAKDAEPEAYKDYLRLRRDYNAAWKDELSNYVRSSGHTTVPMKDVLKHFAELGIQHSMATGFTGNIGALGDWFTKDGFKVNGVPSAAMFPTVKMNPKRTPENEWVFVAVRPNGQLGNYFYTEAYSKEQAQRKFAKVKDFDADKVRKKWLPLITGFDPSDIKCVAAVVLDILYQTSNRIGRPGGNPTGGGFGIATLLTAHVYPQTDGSVKFIYLGKDNVKTTSLIKKSDSLVNKKICEIVHYLIEGKKPKEPLFSYNLRNGTYKPLAIGAVRQLFGALSGGLNVHKLRSAKGSKIFRAYLDTLFSKKKSLDAKGAIEALKKGGLLVGKELNHVRRSAEGTEKLTHTTALKNYIDPVLQAELFSHYGLPLPAYLEKMLATPEGANDVIASAVQTTSDEASTEPQATKDDKATDAKAAEDKADKEANEDALSKEAQEALEQVLSDDVIMDAYSLGSLEHALQD